MRQSNGSVATPPTLTIPFKPLGNKLEILWIDSGARRTGGRYFPYALHLRKAEVLDLTGQWERSEAAYRCNLAITVKFNRPDLLAESHNLLGRVLRNRGEYDLARAELGKALTLFRGLNNQRGVSSVKSNLGAIFWSQGNYAKAMEYFQENLAAAQERGDLVAVSSSVSNIGSVYWHQGNHAKALEYYQQLVRLSEQLNNLPLTGVAVGNLGAALLSLGDYPEAEKYLLRKLRISEQLGDKQHIGIALGNIGEVYQQRHDYPAALDCFQRKLSISEELGDPFNACVALGNLGQLYRKTGQPGRALEYLARAIATGRQRNIRFYLCDCLFFMADLLFSLGRLEECAAVNAEMLAVATEIQRNNLVFRSKVLSAKIAARGDPARGSAMLQQLSAEFTGTEETATINYEIFTLTGDRAARDRALASYRALYARTPHQEYLDRINEIGPTADQRS